MELLQDSVPRVYAVVAAAALYARASSSLLRPGLPRLLALLPVLAFLAAAPLPFTSSATVRGTAAFFLAWLCMFKVGLLAAGRGPLDPALPLLTFLFTALLPVKLRGAGAGASKAKAPVSLVSCAAKVAVLAAVLRLYQFNDRLHLYARLALYGVHMYCFLDLLLPLTAAAGAALGMEMEPQFDRP
jgi:hypothetical protein